MIDMVEIYGKKEYFLVDCENQNQPKAVVEFLKDEHPHCFEPAAQVVCFVGADASQKKWYELAVKHIQGKNIRCNITPIWMQKTGRNAADFMITAYLGILAGKNPYADFFVVSEDDDYDEVIAHFNALGVNVRRVNSKTAKLVESAGVAGKKTAHKSDGNDRKLLDEVKKIFEEIGFSGKDIDEAANEVAGFFGKASIAKKVFTEKLNKFFSKYGVKSKLVYQKLSEKGLISEVGKGKFAFKS